MTCLSAQQRASFGRTRDVRVDRIYPTVTEVRVRYMYVHGVPKPPEHISITDVVELQVKM